MMRIRLAAPADAEAISTLIRGVSHFFTLRPDGAGAEAFLETVSADAIRGYLSSSEYVYRVAEEDGALVGVVAIRDNRHLYHLFVAPDGHGRGLARRLWTEAMDAALRAGNPGEFTVNSSVYAVPVYERFGFVPTGPRVEANGIAFVPMRLTLPADSALPTG
jgi:predicted N-acetyltransferase YhbS